MNVAISELHAEDEGFTAVRRRLAELARLESGWDSYGAHPPTRAALDGALQFARRVERLYWHSAGDRVRPASISPLPTGGIELEWQTSDDLIAVDIGPDGRKGYLRKGGSGRNAHYDERDDVSQEILLSLLADVLVPLRQG